MTPVAYAPGSPVVDAPGPPEGIESIVLAVDPAVSEKRTADASALVTLGRTNDGRVYCLEALARRAAAPDLIQLIDDAERRWNPDVILFESNAAFKGIKDLMTRHARFGSKVQEIVHSRDKYARVNSFSVRVQNGAFLLRGVGGSVHPSQQELLDEMLAFPLGRHDDLLDAAAFGTAYLLDIREPRVWCDVRTGSERLSASLPNAGAPDTTKPTAAHTGSAAHCRRSDTDGPRSGTPHLDCVASANNGWTDCGIISLKPSNRVGVSNDAWYLFGNSHQFTLHETRWAIAERQRATDIERAGVIKSQPLRRARPIG